MNSYFPVSSTLPFFMQKHLKQMQTQAGLSYSGFRLLPEFHQLAKLNLKLIVVFLDENISQIVDVSPSLSLVSCLPLCCTRLFFSVISLLLTYIGVSLRFSIFDVCHRFFLGIVYEL